MTICSSSGEKPRSRVKQFLVVINNQAVQSHRPSLAERTQQCIEASPTSNPPAGGYKPRVVLASRKNAGIWMTLRWAAEQARSAVLIRDDSTEDTVELDVEQGDNPIHVHEHPYVYGAWWGIEYQAPALREAA